MNWLLFALATWMLLGFELSLKHVLQLGPTGVAPSFLVPLAVFVTLGAPPLHALWACLVVGLCLDLTGRPPGAESVIPGPHALGTMLAGQLVLASRGMVIRRNPLSLAVLSILASLLIALVVVFIYSLRSWLVSDLPWNGVEELVRRSGSALYTGITGFLLALVFIPSAGRFGFHHDHHGRATSRRF